uniref:Uncharacterized protein n=1 Tax=Ixodes ricinus TaxID=34613 RepID=A0A6B0U5V8_IXORI
MLVLRGTFEHFLQKFWIILKINALLNIVLLGNTHITLAKYLIFVASRYGSSAIQKERWRPLSKTLSFSRSFRILYL